MARTQESNQIKSKKKKRRKRRKRKTHAGTQARSHYNPPPSIHSSLNDLFMCRVNHFVSHAYHPIEHPSVGRSIKPRMNHDGTGDRRGSNAPAQRELVLEDTPDDEFEGMHEYPFPACSPALFGFVSWLG